jgi:hypothetical protein
LGRGKTNHRWARQEKAAEFQRLFVYGSELFQLGLIVEIVLQPVVLNRRPK